MSANNESVYVDIPRKVQSKLIDMYKSFPCLWDRRDFTYREKKKRHEAVTKLTKFVQEYNPRVTRVHVLKKIESFRASMRREMRKVQKSQLTATTEDEVHKPRLWYYEKMLFLRNDNSTPPIKKKTEESGSESEPEPEPEEAEVDSYDVSSDYNYAPEYATNIEIEPVQSTSSQKRYIYTEDNPKRLCTRIEDEYDAIGINVAAKLRSLPTNMRILAEKLINDVLFEAQTNNLTSTSVITNPADPFK